MSGFSRRGFLKGAFAVAGAAVGTRITGSAGWLGNAFAAPSAEPASVVVVHFVGGFNALFASADSLTGSFGITGSNITPIGGGLVVDSGFASALPAFAKSHMAAIGVKHNQTAHPTARTALWTHMNANSGLVLADAMGGSASIKAAVCGNNMVAEAPTAAYNGISFQGITDLQKTVDALAGTTGPRTPDRGVALGGMTAAQAMSKNALAASPGSLQSFGDGMNAAVATLAAPVKSFDLAGIKTAYGVGAGNAVNSFAAKLAAAELMVQAGTSVISVFDRPASAPTGWDSHGDNDGSEVRRLMNGSQGGYVTAPLATFINRVVADPTRNVTLVLMGDFSRSLPGSNHQPNLTALAFGKNVKVGTTGKVNAQVGLPTGTPSTEGFWAYLAAMAKTTSTPFGANPHDKITL
jgi:hypothetical protein